MSAILQSLLFLLFSGLLAVIACAKEPIGPPGRIILIVIDTLRRDFVGHYGGENPTPNIDALARRGVAVDAMASFHQTTMSMGALFTGRVPSLESGKANDPIKWQPATWCGMARYIDEIAEGRCLPPSLPTLGETLQDAGYYGVGVVANSLLFRPAGFHRGFEVWTEVGARSGSFRHAAERARSRTYEHVHAALEQALDPLPAGQLFLYIHYTDVHDYRVLGTPYVDAVAKMDAGIGELLALLEERGLLENAAIVLTSDHGEALAERHVVKGLPKHGGNPSFGTVLDVPLIAVGVAPERVRPLMRTQNVYDLLAGVAGMPATASDELGEGELLVTELFYRTYRKGRFKSIWGRHDDSFVVLDLESDPGETRDVAADHADVADEHRARIEVLSRALAAASELETEAVPEFVIERLRELGYADRELGPGTTVRRR